MIAQTAEEKVRKDLVDKMKDEWCWILDEVVELAVLYWKDREDDFCLQSASGGVIVFGGTNRLLWSARTGFIPDRIYCTQGFLDNYNKIGRLPAVALNDGVRFEVRMDRKLFNAIRSAAMVRQMSGNAYGLLDAFIVKFVTQVDEGSAGYFFEQKKESGE